MNADNGSLISVIIPVYNVEKYLRQCLDSVVNQTFHKIEIICVNDGSTDNSLEILKEYARCDKRIKIVDLEKGGVSVARNAGLELASGEYIGFIDSDDWIDPDTYERVLYEFKKDKEIDLVCFGAEIVSDDLPGDHPRVTGEKKYHAMKFSGKQKMTDDVIFDTTVTVWNKLFRASVLKKLNLRFPDGYILEDNYFFYCYAVNIQYGYYLDKYFYKYRQRANSIMGCRDKVAAPRLSVFSMIVSYYEEHGLAGTHIGLLGRKFCQMYNGDRKNSTHENLKKIRRISAEIEKILFRYDPVNLLKMKIKRMIPVPIKNFIRKHIFG
ncbi:MAG: glycosyltransferase [Spirochaetia bacterium]|nr:glycosyltransferase [Spirochaetia bacterium]